jgi:hypothetical protein
VAPATGPVERTYPTGWHRLRAALALAVLVVALGVLGALILLGSLITALWVLARALG